MARLGNAHALAPAVHPKAAAVHLPYTSDLFTPGAPQAGLYSPVIGQEVEKSRRELNDQLEKLARTQKWSHQELEQKRREVGLGRQQTVADTNRNLGYDQADNANRLQSLGINFSRDIEDLSTSKMRGQQDYERTLTNLQHEYGARAEQQSQNAIQQGVDEPGTNAASAAVRGANQAFDKGNVDLGHQRNEEDFATREARDRADYERNVGLAGQELGRQQQTGQIEINRADQGATRQQHGLTHSWLHTLAENAANASHARREQGLYETNAAADAVYEANKLHPNAQLSIGGAPTGTAAHGLAIGLGHPAVAPSGINIGGRRRLTPARY